MHMSKGFSRHHITLLNANTVPLLGYVIRLNRHNYGIGEIMIDKIQEKINKKDWKFHELLKLKDVAKTEQRNFTMS